MRSARNESAMSWCESFCLRTASRGWDLLDASGLMRAILPEIDRDERLLCSQNNFTLRATSSSTRA